MDYGKTWFTMGLFFLVAIVIWIGFSIYFSFNKLDINPNASSYVQNIQPSFDNDTLKSIVERVDKLPVPTSTFLDIVNQQD